MLLSEREKMLLGEPYDAGDEDLVVARVRARRLTQLFATLDPADNEAREQLLRDLLGDLGAGSWVEAPFNCDYGSQIHLGDRVYVNMGCVFLDAAAITIHDDAQLGPRVQLLTSDHPRDAAQRADGLESAHPISIGARAWLGGGAIVLPGVEIGHDTIIGAGSVVTRSVEPGVVAVGNPCRVIADSEGRRPDRSEKEGLV
jgi:maltose O-acetyltransferase